MTLYPARRLSVVSPTSSSEYVPRIERRSCVSKNALTTESRWSPESPARRIESSTTAIAS